jgi:hypothetical protein
MSAKIKNILQIMPSNRALIMGLIALLAATATTGFMWMHSENIIAPPGLRLMSWLWRVLADPQIGSNAESYLRALAGLM